MLPSNNSSLVYIESLEIAVFFFGIFFAMLSKHAAKNGFFPSIFSENKLFSLSSVIFAKPNYFYLKDSRVLFFDVSASF